MTAALRLVLLAGVVTLTLGWPQGRSIALRDDDSAPDTAVLGVIQPAGAGQTVTVMVDGVPCAPVGGGPTTASGSYGIVVNCPVSGTAVVLVNGYRAGGSFRLVPGLVYTVNVFRSFLPAVSNN